MNWVNNSASVLSNNDNLSFYVLNTFLTPSCCDFNCCALLWGAASTYEVQFSENESDWKVFALTTEWHFFLYIFLQPIHTRKENRTAQLLVLPARPDKDWVWKTDTGVSTVQLQKSTLFLVKDRISVPLVILTHTVPMTEAQWWT